MDTALGPLVGRSISKRFGNQLVLPGIDLVASPGQRVGLVGENGSGKSTLLRVLAGQLTPDGGEVERPAELIYLPQVPPFDDGQTVRQVLEQAVRPIRESLAELENLSGELDRPASAQRYAELLDWAEVHGAWDLERRTRQAQETLGIEAIDEESLIGDLSGGERSRLAIATIITSRPTCLVLDEPTNHLDDAAMTLLEDLLRDLPGVVVAASHDRVFLDRVVTHIVDLDPSHFGTDGEGGRRYRGNFSSYVEQRSASLRRWHEAFKAEQDKLDDLRSAVQIGTGAVAHGRAARDNDKALHNFKGGKVEQTLARRKRNAERRLEVAERDQIPKPPAPLRFRLPTTRPSHAGGLVAQIRGLSVPGRVELKSWDLAAEGRTLVTGPNGSGKSTLLGVLSGRVTKFVGQVDVRTDRVRELRQDVVFPDPEQPAGQAYRLLVGPEAPELRSLGLLHPREHAKPVSSLSVGQQRRLGLAVAMASECDLLLLDEPSNHLSLALVDELEEVFSTAPMALVVASHDRWLRERWTDERIDLG